MLKKVPWRALLIWGPVAIGGIWLASRGPLRPLLEKIRPSRPHFQEAVWRAPTGWEAFRGFDNGLTVRLVSSPDVVPYPVVELQNAAGDWEPQIGATLSDVYPGGRWRTFYEERTGFVGQRFVRLDDTITTRISWSDSGGRTADRNSRIVALSRQGAAWPSRAQLAKPTFSVRAVDLDTLHLAKPTPSLPLSKVPPGSKEGLLHRISVDLVLSNSQPGHSGAVVLPSAWQLLVPGEKALPLQLSGYPPVDATGHTTATFVLEERLRKFARGPSTVTGTISAGGSWPVRLTIQIPLGLPRKPGPGKVSYKVSAVSGNSPSR